MSKTIPTGEEVLAELVKAGAIDVFGREIRTCTSPNIEVRESEDSDEVFLEGHAAVFNQETIIGSWFREEIAPGAFKKTLNDGADVRHLFNHDPSQVLARTKSGTLTLSEDKIGLAFIARLDMLDPDAQRVVRKVKRGDVSQSSFAFLPVKVEWEESVLDEETGTRTLPKRIIKEARLFDTSTVTYPAYEAAETFLRSAGLDILGGALGLDKTAMTHILRGLSGIREDDAVEDKDFVPAMRSAAEAAARLADEFEARGLTKDTEAGPTPTSITIEVATLARSLAEIVTEHLDGVREALAAEEALAIDEVTDTDADEDVKRLMRVALRERLYKTKGLFTDE